MRMLRWTIAAAVLVALVIVVRLFPDHNRTAVDIDLLLASIPGVELWLALLTTFATGVGCALVVSFLFWVRSGMLGRRYRKTISELEAEVHHLRNLPLARGSLGESDGDFESDTGRVESGR
jgi:uncharacterized membrane protein YciS (DUF1049 family)